MVEVNYKGSIRVNKWKLPYFTHAFYECCDDSYHDVLINEMIASIHLLEWNSPLNNSTHVQREFYCSKTLSETNQNQHQNSQILHNKVS